MPNTTWHAIKLLYLSRLEVDSIVAAVHENVDNFAARQVREVGFLKNNLRRIKPK